MQHYRTIDPQKEWASGRLAKCVRLRVLVPTASVNSLFSLSAAAYEKWQFAISLLVLAVALITLGLVVRYFILTKLRTEECLHGFIHRCRDHIFQIDCCTSPEEYVARISGFHDLATQQIAEFFRVRDRNHDHGAAIRLAENINGNECYVTKSRSGLNPTREETTEPLPSNLGLASALREKNTQGVYIVNDLEAAANEPGWYETKNDRLEDVNALMAAPINGRDGNSKSMLGILYVTSKSKKFTAADTEALKICADLLGTYYTIIFHKIESHLNAEELANDTK